MSLIGRALARLFAPPRRGGAARPPVPRARFDAAQTTPENRNHWANADDLGPNAAADPDTRARLRRRARYERDNDPHLCGLAKTLAHDLVGTGPRLQLTLGEDHYEAARLVEQSFAAWALAADLSDDLRVMCEARPFDGEAFGVFINNDTLPHPVKLDLRVLEAEQVQTPVYLPTRQAYTGRPADGVEFDAAGNPVAYHVLNEHPGDGYAWGSEYTRVPARNVVHWFRPARPGQARGVCELAASLPIGAQTRRYAAAVLTAAEFAAMLAGVLTTDAPADADSPAAAPEISAMDEISMVRGALLTVPKGWDAKQFKAENPTGTHKEFCDQKRNEMARPVLAPFNVISGNSSGYNYSSGRLDHVPYHRIVWIERDRLRKRVLDKLFLAWFAEAERVGLVPDTLPPVNEWTWDWHWDGFASIDPLKDTQAVELQLRLNLTTLSEVCAADGRDWREVLKQRAAELAYAKELGLPTGLEPPAPAPVVQPQPTPDDGGEAPDA